MQDAGGNGCGKCDQASLESRNQGEGKIDQSADGSGIAGPVAWPAGQALLSDHPGHVKAEKADNEEEGHIDIILYVQIVADLAQPK